jgi:hypothetical protein
MVTSLNGLTDGKSQSFVESACWSDDIRSHNKGNTTDYFANWHFKNIPYNPSGMIIPHSAVDEYSNSIEALKSSIQSVSNPEWADSNFQKSMSMRFLIHILGDMHQPLHNAALFNATYPRGDLGGNRLNVKLPNGTFVNLHSLWDAVFYNYSGLNSTRRPLNNFSVKNIEQAASNLVSAFPRSYFAKEL